MNRLFVFASVSVFFAVAAFAEGNEARVKFIQVRGESFKGNAVAADALDADDDFERATGESMWQIALPVDDDDRVRFLDAVFRGGKFVRGSLHTFGFPEEKISANRFAQLRAESVMVARRSGAGRFIKRNGREYPQELAVYAPTSRPLRYKAPAHPDGIRIDPCGRVLGYSRRMFDSISVGLSTLRYSVTLEGPGGVKVPLGEFTATAVQSEKAMAKAIRSALEKRLPARVGAISDRDVADFYGLSTIVCTGVGSGIGK